MSIETRERQQPEEPGAGDGFQRSTYRTLDEQEGRLSEAEQRFERRRRTVGLFLGPISIAAASDLNPTIPALAAIFAANYGFMLPVSTPPNAIVYSSGLLPITRMLKAGAVFDIIGAVLCVVGVIAMANLVGLA